MSWVADAVNEAVRSAWSASNEFQESRCDNRTSCTRRKQSVAENEQLPQPHQAAQFVA
eukprot:CAMPEP_0179140366 /NCGR_PEP_ID=MMETSP0796-20121207/67204_1 /TAXON_ID=73915 /ORGANISM="Pyrodinium bahamense, Strain pbaha01" /LENGTH=57 /DNA_ID=CAMNT_0020839897 /DNA_START=22 /DNA_END=195 /DNA_ORIENTATION=-